MEWVGDDGMHAGHTLYIPALWFHHVTAGDASPSIAVNMFSRSLPQAEYHPKDVYGNKELTAGAAAVAAAAHGGAALAHLPEPYRSFYSEQACAALRAAAIAQGTVAVADSSLTPS
jgi:tRNA wybutosine-synthesizing protein 5